MRYPSNVHIRFVVGGLAGFLPKAALDANVLWLRAEPRAKITIEGYCDERGTPRVQPHPWGAQGQRCGRLPGGCRNPR